MPSIPQGSRNAAPQSLPGWKLLMHILAFPICIAMFIAGCLGMNVLLDSDGTGYLSNTEFGTHYRQLIQKNPFFSAFFVNGGLLGAAYIVIRIREHNRAVKAKRDEAAKSTETKKTQ